MSAVSPDFAPDTAAGHGLALCHSCNRVDSAGESHCPRCYAPLHVRKPESLQRTLAYAVAALILYIPANLLPVLHLDAVTGPQENTIVGGVIQFWQSGDYPVALIIFVASVMIPILKLLSITALCIVSRTGKYPRAMTKLYRVTELIGRWSMVDVFVVAILVAVVQLGGVMSIHPGPGVVPFAAVVILTIFSAESFDPRLIWDAAARRADADSG